jgi:hypothetical protein
VEIRFAIMIALTASEVADIDPKRNRQWRNRIETEIAPHGDHTGRSECSLDA